MKKENRRINVLKGIACILVVLNHYHGIGVAGEIIYAVSHVGVPVFFLISGYYMYAADCGTSDKLPRKIYHIFSLVMLHIGLNVLDFISQCILLRDNMIRRDVVINELAAYFTVDSIVSSVVWSTSLIGIGQWFLMALLEAYIFFWIVYKVRLGRFVEKNGIILSILLFAFHIPIRVILIKLNVHQLFGMMTAQTSFVRNVWFDAIPFMLIGLGIRAKDISVKKISLLPFITIFATLMSVSEMFLTNRFLGYDRISSVLYCGTIVAVVSAFLWAISNNRESLNPLLIAFEYIGKHLSMIVYFIHVIVANYIQRLILREEQPWVLLVLVMFFSIIISWIAYIINQRLKSNTRYSVSSLLLTALLISFLILPSGSEYRMILKTVEAGVLDIQETLASDAQSTIMITAQDNSGMTVDALEMPVTQFIGGGINRTVYVGNDEYTYNVVYLNERSLMVKKMDGISQVRVWVK